VRQRAARRRGYFFGNGLRGGLEFDCLWKGARCGLVGLRTICRPAWGRGAGRISTKVRRRRDCRRDEVFEVEGDLRAVGVLRCWTREMRGVALAIQSPFSHRAVRTTTVEARRLTERLARRRPRTSRRKRWMTGSRLCRDPKERRSSGLLDLTFRSNRSLRKGFVGCFFWAGLTAALASAFSAAYRGLVAAWRPRSGAGSIGQSGVATNSGTSARRCRSVRSRASAQGRSARSRATAPSEDGSRRDSVDDRQVSALAAPRRRRAAARHDEPPAHDRREHHSGRRGSQSFFFLQVVHAPCARRMPDWGAAAARAIAGIAGAGAGLRADVPVGAEQSCAR